LTRKQGYEIIKEDKETMNTIIYKNKKGATKLFQIAKVNAKNLFGNRKENTNEVGFRARVINRDNEVRSFRYDGIVELV